MSIENRTLLPLTTLIGDSDQSVLSIGSKAVGAGYNKNTDGIHTIVFDLSDNWEGYIKIQGTLSLYPGNDDWFDIETYGDFSTTDYAGLGTINIVGKFVWLRAAYNTQTGQINEIRYSF